MSIRFSRRRLLVTAGAVGATGLIAACQRAEPAKQFNTVDISGAPYAAGFSLPDTDGKLRTLEEFRGQAVAVFFGFTQCPDVCPTTLTELTQVKKLLGEHGKRLQVVFITVDPERDTQAVLRAYMTNFDPSFLALVPNEEQLATVAKDFKIHYKKIPGTSKSGYLMEHTAATYVFDPEGRVRLFVRYGMEPQAVANDVRQLMTL